MFNSREAMLQSSTACAATEQPRDESKTSAADLPGPVLIGKVVGVSDGDTITVLVDRQPMKVRLTEIDALKRLSPRDPGRSGH